MSRTDLASGAESRQLDNSTRTASSNEGAIGGDAGVTHHHVSRRIQNDDQCATAARRLSLLIPGTVPLISGTSMGSDGVSRLSDALDAWTNMMDLTASVGDFVLRKKVELTRARHAKRNHPASMSCQENKRIRMAPPTAGERIANPSAGDVGIAEGQLTGRDVAANSSTFPDQDADARLALDVDRVRSLAHLLVRIKTANSSFREEIVNVLAEAHEGPEDDDEVQRSQVE